MVRKCKMKGCAKFARSPTDTDTKNGVHKNTDINKTGNLLLYEICKQIGRIKSETNKELVEVIKLFYDE
jgi:hypothetical protein